jgi:16S rRNA (uracil1498-N3)-methyltransferase
VRLTRVHVDAVLQPGTLVELPSGTAAHLAKVLRARAGDPLVLFSGDGREFAGVIEKVHGSRVTAAVGEGRNIDRESPLAITLIQCVPRGDRMDFVVQKATELGVARIVPVLSRRSVMRLDEKQAESKAAHWRAVATAACEQCGRNRLPIVDAPLQLINYLGDAPVSGVRLLLDPEHRSMGPAHIAATGVEIATGPEGGFAPEELEAFRVAKFRGLSLGPRILRTETAAIAAVTWLQTRFGDMRADEGVAAVSTAAVSAGATSR